MLMPSVCQSQLGPLRGALSALPLMLMMLWLPKLYPFPEVSSLVTLLMEIPPPPQISDV